MLAPYSLSFFPFLFVFFTRCKVWTNSMGPELGQQRSSERRTTEKSYNVFDSAVSFCCCCYCCSWAARLGISTHTHTHKRSTLLKIKEKRQYIININNNDGRWSRIIWSVNCVLSGSFWPHTGQQRRILYTHRDLSQHSFPLFSVFGLGLYFARL